MGECLITRRGGETYKLPILNANYPENVTTIINTGETASATFTAVIYEPGNPAVYTYQWYVNGIAVEGATDSVYKKGNLTENERYSVYCEVTNKKGAVTTRIATLEVICTPGLDGNYPKDATVAVHSGVTCEVVSDGSSEPYTYQWYKNDSAVAGATSSKYTFTPIEVGTVTVYCKVTNNAGTVTTRTATITVTGLSLFDSGNENTTLTGGWTAKTASIAQVVNRGITKGTNSITCKIQRYESRDHEISLAGTEKKINVADFDVLKMSISSFSNKNSDGANQTTSVCRFGLYDSDINAPVAYKAINGNGDVSLDISQLDGEYYIFFGCNSYWRGSYSGSDYTEFTASSAALE